MGSKLHGKCRTCREAGYASFLSLPLQDWLYDWIFLEATYTHPTVDSKMIQAIHTYTWLARKPMGSLVLGSMNPETPPSLCCLAHPGRKRRRAEGFSKHISKRLSKAPPLTRLPFCQSSAQTHVKCQLCWDDPVSQHSQAEFEARHHYIARPYPRQTILIITTTTTARSITTLNGAVVHTYNPKSCDNNTSIKDCLG